MRMRARCLNRLLTPHTKVCIAAYGWVEEGQGVPRSYWVRVEGDTHSFTKESEAKEFFEIISAPLEAYFRAILNGSEHAKRAKLKCLLATQPQTVS